MRWLRHLKWWLLGLVRGKAYVHGLRLEQLMRADLLRSAAALRSGKENRDHIIGWEWWMGPGESLRLADESKKVRARVSSPNTSPSSLVRGGK